MILFKLIDTRRIFFLLKVLHFLPFSGYIKKNLYIRLRMPWSAEFYPDKIPGGFVTIMQDLLQGKLNDLNKEQAIKKVVFLPLKKKSFIIAKLITINPLLAYELYKYFNIDNTQYKYLHYHLFFDNTAKDFFSKMCDKDIKSYLNQYNYFIKAQKYSQALNSLKNYYNHSALEPVFIKNRDKPLYVDNLTTQKAKAFKNQKKKISIIITTYNEEKLLPYALQSLFMQSYQNFEILFVDDCSDDDTVSIFEKICQENHFTEYTIIRMHDNAGTFVGKNIALKYAKGELITFHDADDWSHPQKLEQQVIPLINSKYKASISSMVRIRPDGSLFSKQIFPVHQICMISLMFKKEIFEKFGFFYTDLIGSDSEYYERIVIHYGKKKIKHIDDILTFAAHRNNSLMTSNTPDYGISTKRMKHWERCRKRQLNLYLNGKSTYINFNINHYNYNVLYKGV